IPMRNRLPNGMKPWARNLVWKLNNKRRLTENFSISSTEMAIEPPLFNLEGSSLQVDKDFYRRIAASVNASTLVGASIITIRTCMAWEAPAGSVFRIGEV